jgi:hypothetical protein
MSRNVLRLLCVLTIVAAATSRSAEARVDDSCPSSSVCSYEFFPCSSNSAEITAHCQSNAPSGCTATTPTCNDGIANGCSLGMAKVTCNYGSGPINPGGG